MANGNPVSYVCYLPMKNCGIANYADKGKWLWLHIQKKKFTKEQIQQLFLSVHWTSGNYPECLYKALMNSSTVLTVWDDEKLVGLTRVLDDTEMLAQIHYVLVHPAYQGKVIVWHCRTWLLQFLPAMLLWLLIQIAVCRNDRIIILE